MKFAALVSLLCFVACQTPSREKGGLVPVAVSTQELENVLTGRRFALVIGMDAVSDGSWRPLRYAVKDAGDVAATLRDPARGAFTDVVVLAGIQQTTRAAILEALSALRARAHRRDDEVVIYVSAHGTLARDERGELRRYLVTSDARLSSISTTALAVDALKALLDSFVPRRRLLVLATCHSGSGKSLLPPDVLAELSTLKAGFYAPLLETVSGASIVLAACDWGETAREDDELQNDIYTHFLVEGLTGSADRNLDGAVTATEAHDYARRRTYEFTHGRQRPSAEMVEVGADPIVLTGAFRNLGAPELFSYSPRLDGFALLVDGQPQGELPGGAAIRPGRHRIELVKGGPALYSGEIDLSSGQRLELESLMSAGAPRHTLSLLGAGFGFLDADSRQRLLPFAFGPGLSMRLDDVPLARLSLLMDATFSSRHAELALPGGNVPFTYTGVTGGVAAVYRWKLGRLSLSGGPRVAALWLSRSFTQELYPGVQQYFTVAPGLSALAALALWNHWEVSAQLHVMLTFVMVDGVSQTLGFSGASVGAGYRF